MQGDSECKVTVTVTVSDSSSDALEDSLAVILATSLIRILTAEPNRNPSTYPRTRPYPSSSLRQFQPSWMKQYPWLHYSRFADGAFCRACAPSSQGLGMFVTSHHPSNAR